MKDPIEPKSMKLVQYPETLTKRELFAAMAMQGAAADPTSTASTERIATWSVSMADALLKELEK